MRLEKETGAVLQIEFPLPSSLTFKPFPSYLHAKTTSTAFSVNDSRHVEMLPILTRAEPHLWASGADSAVLEHHAHDRGHGKTAIRQLR